MARLEHDPLGLFERFYRDGPHTWRDDVPDWRDWGARVELKYGPGNVAEGWLYVREEFYDGEDEWPLWGVVSDGMEDLSFYDAIRWRFAPKPKSK